MHIASSDWFQRLLRRSPRHAFEFIAQTEGLPPGLVDKAHEVFAAASRIEFEPLGGDKQDGWMIIIDQKFSLWFYQQDDHYVYDGFEIGDYSPDPEIKGI